MLFIDNEAYNAYLDQIQLKYEGEDIVFTGYLIEFHDTFFEKVKLNDVKMSLFFKSKEVERKNCLKNEEFFSKMYSCCNRETFLRRINGFC